MTTCAVDLVERRSAVLLAHLLNRLDKMLKVSRHYRTTASTRCTLQPKTLLSPKDTAEGHATAGERASVRRTRVGYRMGDFSSIVGMI